MGRAGFSYDRWTRIDQPLLTALENPTTGVFSYLHVRAVTTLMKGLSLLKEM